MSSFVTKIPVLLAWIENLFYPFELCLTFRFRQFTLLRLHQFHAMRVSKHKCENAADTSMFFMLCLRTPTVCKILFHYHCLKIVSSNSLRLKNIALNDLFDMRNFACFIVPIFSANYRNNQAATGSLYFYYFMQTPRLRFIINFTV